MNLTTPVHDTLDATSAADTSYHTTPSVGFYQMIRLTTKVRKVSGTVSGIGLLQGSDDASSDSWIDISTDTLQINDISISKKSWLVNPHSYRYYRVWLRLATGVAVPVTTGYFIKP